MHGQEGAERGYQLRMPVSMGMTPSRVVMPAPLSFPRRRESTLDAHFRGDDEPFLGRRGVADAVTQPQAL